MTDVNVAKDGRSGEVRAAAIRRHGPALLVVLAVCLAYANCLSVPFLFDDTAAIEHNPTIRRLRSIEVLNPPTDGSASTGRPVVNLSYALNYAVSGERVWSYHVVNVAIHAAGALALMGIVRGLAGRGGVPGSPGMGFPSVAFGSALWWALHPLQTETVLSVAQRTESLCGLFYLLALYGLTASVEPGARARRWQVFSVVACLAGMGTKEVMVTAPLVLLLFDRTFLAGTFAGALRERRGYYVALALTWLPLAWLVARGGGARGVAAGFGLGVSVWTYLLKQCEAITTYLKLVFWPHPLVLDYGTEVVQSPADVAWSGIIVLGLLAATVWALVRKPAAGFVGAWFFLILSPSSSVVPLVTQTMAEHRLYLPLAALMVAFLVLGRRILGRRATGTALAIAAAAGAVTFARNETHRTAVSIWSDTVAKVPGNARAHNNLAWALHQEGNLAAANRHFARAIELRPGYASARYNWGVALLEQQRAGEAVEQLEAAVRLAPGHVDALFNLGSALVRLRRPVEAIARYEEALRLRPGADVHFNLGLASVEAGQRENASRHFLAALESEPALTEAHYQLARLAGQAGNAVEEEARLAMTVRWSPDHAAAHARLGLLLARSSRLAAAAEHLRAAVRLRPGDADALANLGNVLLLQGRPAEAIAHYEGVLRLRPDDERARENLRLARESAR